MQVPRKSPLLRVTSQRDQIQRTSEANNIWNHDFVFDTALTGQPLKCPTVIDVHSREALAIYMTSASSGGERATR